jgi:Protein of unknown function (DUF2867)
MAGARGRADPGARVMAELGAVRQIALPPDARARSTLPHVDYADAFVVDTDGAPDRTPEEWARAILEGAPAATRRVLTSGWLALGLRVGAAPPGESVLGWEVRRSTADHLLLGARSHAGMPAELLFERRDKTLLFATLVRYENPAVRALWAGVMPVHLRVVRSLLEQAG